MEKSNRLLAVHILEILNEHSNSKYTMSQMELMDRLEDKYGEKISRHTCSDYLKELRQEGYVIGNRGVYRNDLFTERELRTLIDGVMYGKHIPEKDAKILIDKLKNLSLCNMKGKAKNITYLSAINRTRNDSLYDILDIIDDAIERDLKLEIVQHSPQIDGTRKDWSAKIVDPYFVVSDQSRYYLLCNVNRDGRLLLEPRRIDRFSRVRIVVEKRVPLIDVVGHDFNLGQYMKEHIYMFAGDAGRAEIRIDNRHIGSFEDWYGTEYKLIANDGESSIIRINTNYDALYYWLLQYGGIAEAVEPVELRNRVKEGLKEILAKYE